MDEQSIRQSCKISFALHVRIYWLQHFYWVAPNTFCLLKLPHIILLLAGETFFKVCAHARASCSRCLRQYLLHFLLGMVYEFIEWSNTFPSNVSIPCTEYLRCDQTGILSSFPIILIFEFEIFLLPCLALPLFFLFHIRISLDAFNNSIILGIQHPLCIFKLFDSLLKLSYFQLVGAFYSVGQVSRLDGVRMRIELRNCWRVLPELPGLFMGHLLLL